MITATRIFDFASAHYLLNHNSSCKYMHGHNYKMHVTVMSINDDMNDNNNASDYGMVIDFKELNNIIKTLIIDVYDHSLMIWDQDETFKDFIDKFNYNDYTFFKNIKRVPFRPTAENMSCYFYKVIDDYFISHNYNIRMKSIKLYETDNSYVEYSE